MDKGVIFAVAGAGKTTHLIDRLTLDRRVLLLTYTENNFANLKRKIIEKFGYIPGCISLNTYFTFLHSFCFRPYLQMKMRSRGIEFDAPPEWTARLPIASEARYLSPSRRIYHSRMARLLETKGLLGSVQRRLERYFDAIYVDEIQDFGGHDFDLLMSLCSTAVDALLVGDFFQYTYATSQDGAINKNLHDDYATYQKRFIESGLEVDTKSFSKSHRCSFSVCEFIRENLGIDIYPHSDRRSDILIVENQDEVERLHALGSTVKLFYQKHTAYGCYSQNWGASKGEDHYQDVCVVLNAKAWADLKRGELKNSSPLTRNRLYVACSRARGDLYIAPESLFKRFKLP